MNNYLEYLGGSNNDSNEESNNNEDKEEIIEEEVVENENKDSDDEENENEEEEDSNSGEEEKVDDEEKEEDSNEEGKVDVKLLEKENSINFDIFGNIKTDISIEYDYEKIEDYTEFFYEDTILQTELENTLLKQLPFSKQNNILYQNSVLQSVNNFIKLKNEATVILNKCFRDDSLKDKTYKGIFNSSIIPITVSKKKIFKTSDESPDNTETDVLLDKNVYYSSFSGEMKEIFQTDDNYRNGDISYIDYEKKIYNITKPYENVGNFGYNMCPNYLFSALRISDLDTIKWSMKNCLDNYCIYLEDHNKENVVTMKKQCILAAEETAIVGFLILNDIFSDFKDIFKDSMYEYVNFNKIGEITNITKDKEAIITCNKHKLNNNDNIVIANSNLPINGSYQNIKVLTNDTFSININTCDINITGKLGEVVASLPLNINIANLKKNKTDILIENEKENENNIFLFDNLKLNNAEYQCILDKIIPRLGEKITNKIKEVKSIKDLLEIKNYLIINKYNLNFKDDKEYIDEYNSKLLELIESEKTPVPKGHINKEKIIYLLSNDILLSPEIKEAYGEFNPEKGTGSNNFRLEWLESQLDYGKFYYYYVSKYIFDNLDIQKNKKIYEEILKTYQGKIKQSKEIIDEEEKTKDFFKCKKYKFEVGSFDDLEKLEDISNGDIALAITEKKIYTYNNDKWIFVKENKSITSLKELCLIDKNIKDITIKDIVCEYENECVNRKYRRHKINYENY